MPRTGSKPSIRSASTTLGAKIRQAGAWAARDPFAGRVQVLPARPDANVQAQLAMAEVERLRSLDPAFAWADVAILARTRRALAPLQACCEQNEVPPPHGPGSDGRPTAAAPNARRPSAWSGCSAHAAQASFAWMR